MERRLAACAGDEVWAAALEVPELLEELLAYQARRRSRVQLRAVAQQFTTLPRLASCGKSTVTTSGGPVLRVSGTSAGYAGVATCGSVWCCPSCAAKVAASRAEDLAAVMRKVLESGGSASLMTFTVRHHQGQSLKELWDGVGYAWSKVTSGAGWLDDQQVGGMRGWVRAVEATYGDHGWHPHIHVLVCWKDRISLELATEVGESMHVRWDAALRRKGFESWRHKGGLDVRMASLTSDNLADYFVKISREVVSSATKETRKGRPPFAILRDTDEHHLADDMDLWLEWERASFRRRQLTWSLGDMDLRKWAELGREKTDEEIAAEELDGESVLGLTAETWGWLVAEQRTTELLDVAELGGPDGAIAWLDSLGLGWLPVTPGRSEPASPEARARQRARARPALYKMPA